MTSLFVQKDQVFVSQFGDEFLSSSPALMPSLVVRESTKERAVQVLQNILHVVWQGLNHFGYLTGGAERTTEMEASCSAC